MWFKNANSQFFGIQGPTVGKKVGNSFFFSRLGRMIFFNKVGKRSGKMKSASGSFPKLQITRKFGIDLSKRTLAIGGRQLF